MMRTVWMLVLLAWSWIGTAIGGQMVTGMVRTVYDGDTVLLTTKEQSRFKVRLYGIDAPETGTRQQAGQPFAAVARRTLMYKILGRQVSAEVVDTDQHHRAVAILRYGGRDINREMVVEGLAWAYDRYLQEPYGAEYRAAEQTARSRRRGVWSMTAPTAPWEFRHQEPIR